MRYLLSNKRWFAAIAGSISIGVICAYVYPEQPYSVLMSLAWCTLWVAFLISQECSDYEND